VIKTVLSIQLAENDMYDYVKHSVTGEKVSEWTANKPLPAQIWVEIVSHLNRHYFPCSIVLKLAIFSAILEPMLPLKGYFPS
jgi:hypothetical protein